MRTLIGGALRAVVVAVLAVASLRLAVWLLDGNDPSSDADIGVGLVPIGMAALVSFVWSWIDARRNAAAQVRLCWLTAAVVCAVAVMLRGLDDVGDSLLVAGMFFVLVVVAALAGVMFGKAFGGPGNRVVPPPTAHGSAH